MKNQRELFRFLKVISLVCKAANGFDKLFTFVFRKGQMGAKFLLRGVCEPLIAAGRGKPKAGVVKYAGLVENKNVNVTGSGKDNVAPPQGI